MQGTLYFAVFLRRLVCFSVLYIAFFVTVCKGGESPESVSFFNFLSAVDPNNVLNISRNNIGSSHPCLLVKLNGTIRCNSNNVTNNIVEIRLENLNLSGTFDADSLCRLQNLRVVSLAKNNIKGTIPSSILHCRRLVYLNVTSNQLSGRLPIKALTRLKYLKNLDISNNNFSGMVPSSTSRQEYRHPFTPIKLESKGVRVWKEVSDDPNTIQPAPGISYPAKQPPWYSRIEVLVGLVLGIGLLLASIYIVVKKLPKLMEEGKVGMMKRSQVVSPLEKPKTHGVKLKGGDSELVFFVEEDHERFTLEDLLRAKADLRSESFCSSLYKVKLENNVQYAVKRLKNLQVSSDEFGETLKQISNVKHPNILPLVGYRSTSEEKLIIYKYQSNGSLLNLLNGKLRL